MFGPDICGTSTRKTHAIFTYKGENLLTKKTIKCETDNVSHRYTLIVRPDNTYEVKIDGRIESAGSLFDDWDFLAPKQIKDPEQSKPKDWVDNAKMVDPEAKKPDGWDDAPAQIPDPEAEQPEDWDVEEDGEWEAPMIDNPACEEAPGCGAWVRPVMKNPEYKGEWKAPMVDNPEYKGEWKAREMQNPGYFESKGLQDLAPVAGAAVEVWTMSGGMQFDNVLLTSDIAAAQQWVQDTWVAEAAAQAAAAQVAQSSARAAARAEALVQGNYGQFALLTLSGVAEAAMENVLLSGLAVAAVSAIMLYSCYACCAGPDDEGAEATANLGAFEAAFSKVDGGSDEEGTGEEAIHGSGSDSEGGEEAGVGISQRTSAASGTSAADADQVVAEAQEE
jgi:hypothetical protein